MGPAAYVPGMTHFASLGVRLAELERTARAAAALLGEALHEFGDEVGAHRLRASRLDRLSLDEVAAELSCCARVTHGPCSAASAVLARAIETATSGGLASGPPDGHSTELLVALELNELAEMLRRMPIAWTPAQEDLIDLLRAGGTR